MEKKKVLSHIFDALTVLIILATVLFCMCAVAFSTIYTKTSVIGYSMYPTLNYSTPSPDMEGDTIFVNKYSKIENGDVVVAKVSWWPLGPIIKRVVASPGDFIQIKLEDGNFNLYVNTKLVTSKQKTDISSEKVGASNDYYLDYLAFLENESTSNNVVEINGEKYIVMLENEYFLMGDNWGETTDSMQKGVVNLENIIGRVDYICEYGQTNYWNIAKDVFIKLFTPKWA